LTAKRGAQAQLQRAWRGPLPVQELKDITVVHVSYL
jgi:hypothetical protein